jgi:hypothetical protein
MTDRSRRAAHADPAHESEESHSSDGQQPDGSPEPHRREEADAAGEPRGGRRSRENREGGEDRGSGKDAGEDNPFAAPPEGAEDRPWQPRHPKGGDERGGTRWGGQWSRRQPGRQDGGFGGPGSPDQGGDGDGRGNGGGRRTPGMRWDPTDPKQRHARYALHGGIWGLFFALFGLTEIALLLGALSVYWGVSALRGPSSVRSAPGAHATAEDVAGTDRKADAPGGTPPQGGSRPGDAEVTVTPAQAAKARRAAAVGGLVAGLLTLLGVAGNFAQQMVYEEYYTCRQDALTQAAREQCQDLPDEQVPPWPSVTGDPQSE